MKNVGIPVGFGRQAKARTKEGTNPSKSILQNTFYEANVRVEAVVLFQASSG